MQIDEYRVLTEAVSFGIAKAWRKTLEKHAFHGNSEKFGKKFLARVPRAVFTAILEVFALDHPHLNVRRVLARCVIAGARYGWQRAFKHTDEPNEELVKEQVFDGIMLEITEYFSFPDAGEEV